MKEIKFRMITQTTGNLLGFADIYGLLRNGSDVLPDLEEAILEGVKFEQYTGLKDKNGREIYEGDIVEALIDGVWGTDKDTIGFGKTKWKLEVIYNDTRFMDVFRVIGSKTAPDRIYYLFDKELSELKVIGNVHECPWLLGGKNE